MKKLAILLLPIYLLSYEIDFQKKFSKKLLPDILSTKISIIIEDNEEKKLMSRLTKFNEKIKDFDEIEKELGTFSIRPQYKYSSNKPIISDYKGVLSYRVSTKNAKFLNNFVSMITSLKKNRDTTVGIDNLRWIVPRESQDISLEILRLEAINWVNSYSKRLSQDINKECSIKSIKIEEQTHYPMHRSAINVAQTQSVEVPVPENSEQEVKLVANYKLECK